MAAMTEMPMQFTSGPPETVLPPEEAEAVAALAAALETAPDRRRDAVAEIGRAHV